MVQKVFSEIKKRTQSKYVKQNDNEDIVQSDGEGGEADDEE